MHVDTIIFNSVVLNWFPAFVKKAFSLLTAGFILLTGWIDGFSQDVRQPELSKQNVILLGAFARSQGVATDGKSYIFSSKWGLLRTELDGVTRLEINAFAIPKDLKEQYGLAHIGGISCYNGKLYAGLEDSKVWDYPVVVVYDAATLEYTGEHYLLDAEIHTRGLPWVAVDADGMLYAADHSVNGKTLYRYDVNKAMEPAGSVALSETVVRIQGADFYKGTLYAATNNDTQAVYAIDPENGAVRKYFDRNLTKGSEGEGMTVLETADGAVFHTLDMGPLFINANFRHFAPVV